MKWREILLSVACLIPCPVFADPAAMPANASQACRQAVAVAERVHGIPPHLLAAIARVESGRRGANTNSFNPWPWTVNLDGQGSFYETEPQAVAAAKAMRPRVTHSIDVGCMQISLTQHPDAFSSMEQAFDPVANVEYAARFLVQLFEKTGSWRQAAGFYHSQTPDLAQDYRRKVYAALPAEQLVASAAEPSSLAAAWAATVARSPFAAATRPVPPRIIRSPAGPSGLAQPGRTLESYRAAPVRFAYQVP
ncbi:MAG TPA: lytic transglycosylase domain-containing protein [Rhodopila sp.]|nr:lytic transglycosylase domain-containing protein [Rhodopila sp.]